MDDPVQAPQDYFGSDDATSPTASSGSQRAVVLLALAAAIGLGALIYQVAGDDAPADNGEEAGEDQPVPDTAPDGVEQLELTPAAPWDGKASRFHPVTVQPASGLAESSVVTVEGWEFPPNRDLGIVQCTNVAVVDGSGGCNIGRFTQVRTNADGYFIGEFMVERYLWVGEDQWDCLQGNVDPDELHQRRLDGLALPGMTDTYFTCVVAAGAIDDYDESGGFPISFEGHPPFLALPDPSAPTRDTTADPNQGPTTVGPGPTTGATQLSPPPFTVPLPISPNPTHVDPNAPTTTFGTDSTVTEYPPAGPTTIATQN